MLFAGREVRRRIKFTRHFRERARDALPAESWAAEIEPQPLKSRSAISGDDLLTQRRDIKAEEFKLGIAIDPAVQWGCRHWIFWSRRSAGVTFFLLHVEAEEFERRIAIDPAVPRMRVEQKDVIGLVGDFAVLFAILVVQGHLASAADDVKNVSLFLQVPREARSSRWRRRARASH